MSHLVQFYGEPGAPIEVEGSPDVSKEAFLRHRRRVESTLAELSQADWGRATRCSEWRVLDLVNHLTTGGRFWALSLRQARIGMPTRFLEGFDPKNSPGRVIGAMSETSPDDALEAFRSVNDELEKVIGDFAVADWTMPAESPIGHVPARFALDHALFDSWIHERDLSIPLGKVPVTEADELVVTVAYMLAIAGLAAAAGDPGLRGTEIDVPLGEPASVTLRLRCGIPVKVGPSSGTGGSVSPLDGAALADAMSGRSDLEGALVTSISEESVSERAMRVFGALEPYLS